MNNEPSHEKVWNIYVTNYGEYECHDLSKDELQGILEDEWNREFNGIFIGRDVDCIGRLMVFFQADSAYVAYEDFERQEWRCSYELDACERPDWDELIRLTPEDTQDYAFRKCSIIPKERALRIVERYLASGELDDLYVSAATGKPIVGQK